MCSASLRDILYSLRDVSFSDASAADLSSYSRILVSLSPVFLSGYFDAEADTRSFYASRAEKLRDAMLSFCRFRGDAAEKSELLCCLFALQPCLSVSTDSSLRRVLISLNKTLFSALHIRETDDEALIRSALKSICFAHYPVPDDESADFLFLRRTLSEWSETMQVNGSWLGVSISDALERLLLMNMNSYMFLDKRYDLKIRSCYAFYSSQPLPLNPSADELRIYGLLCDASLDGNAYAPDKRLFELVSGELSSCRSLFSPSSSPYLYCQSYDAARLCHKALFSPNFA